MGLYSPNKVGLNLILPFILEFSPYLRVKFEITVHNQIIYFKEFNSTVDSRDYSHIIRSYPEFGA